MQLQSAIGTGQVQASTPDAPARLLKLLGDEILPQLAAHYPTARNQLREPGVIRAYAEQLFGKGLTPEHIRGGLRNACRDAIGKPWAPTPGEFMLACAQAAGLPTLTECQTATLRYRQRITGDTWHWPHPLCRHFAAEASPLAGALSADKWDARCLAIYQRWGTRALAGELPPEVPALPSKPPAPRGGYNARYVQARRARNRILGYRRHGVIDVQELTV